LSKSRKYRDFIWKKDKVKQNIRVLEDRSIGHHKPGNPVMPTIPPSFTLE